ncbi:MAG: site-specific DNA-methyltransferase [Proteobacteria bacterium]|nr:site-specific DNA-methyltransferase [Pseudomonadota bacterium]
MRFNLGTDLQCPAVSPSEQVRPAENLVPLLTKTIGLVRDRIEFDPFMGTCPAGEAATISGRAFVGCEINPHHSDTASRRIESTYCRIEEAKGQGVLFAAPPIPAPHPTQSALFRETPP